MKTAPLDIGCSVTGVNAAKATKTEIKKLRDLLYKNRLIVLKDQSLTEAAVLRFRQALRLPRSLSAGQLPPPRISADLRLLERQEGRQADRRRPHRRLLALRYVLREGAQVHHHADAQGSAEELPAQHPLHRHGRRLRGAARRPPRTSSPAAEFMHSGRCATRCAPRTPATTSSRSSPAIDSPAPPCAIRR